MTNSSSGKRFYWERLPYRTKTGELNKNETFCLIVYRLTLISQVRAKVNISEKKQFKQSFAGLKKTMDLTLTDVPS